MVAVMDTIIETNTITIDRNERGDTLRQSVVTDRLRIRSLENIASYRTKTEVRTDTVYIERRDSVATYHGTGSLVNQSGKTTLYTTLRFILWIIVTTGVLVIITRLVWRKW